MIGLQVAFLAGRFHGNHWHYAHNEGIPEWPPSPWRILRALVSAAYAEQLTPAEVAPLLEKLRGLPRYRLPLAVDAHTRHFMPDTDDANHKKSKVFDPFVAIDGGARDPQALTMAWPVELTAPEAALLARLCRRVAYLGRAESWVELSPVNVHEDTWNCWPDERATTAAATTLLAPLSAEDLAAWAREQPAPKKGKDVPRTLWSVLTFDGERYRDEGWSAVPGTRLVRYVFNRPQFHRTASRSYGISRRAERPNVVRYAIRSPVLPRMTEAMAIGERLRMCAMAQSRDVRGEPSPVFSGHGELASEHRHAMYLSTCEDPTNAARGAIDHLVIAARAGFDDEDVLALQRIRRLWGRGGHNLELVLVGLGRTSDYGGIVAPYATVLAEHHVWESVTPFVPTRHPKVVRGTQVDSLEDQLIRGCEQLLGVAPIKVSPVGDKSRWARFRRRRMQGAGSRGPDRAVGARLEFRNPVRGPIALGYSAHYGLGLFAAVTDS